MKKENTFIDDVRFLRDNEAYPVVLKNAEGARLALCPKFQGRVMTSTPNGDSGSSCGWINYALIASGKKTPHVNAYGGEDRFLIGPEGGQFSFYFPKNAEFTFKNWQVPEIFDTRTWIVTDRSGDSEISLAADFEAEDWSGNKKEIRIERSVRLLSSADAEKKLGIAIPKDKLKTVAFTSLNKITNRGTDAWTEKTGAVSIRIPGMFKTSSKTVIAIPFRKDAPGETAIFNALPKIPVTVCEEKGILYFPAGGSGKEKIGLFCERAKGVLGSYDPERGLLTVLLYTQAGSGAEYVNSVWKIQKEPFKGEVLNACSGEIPGSDSVPFYGFETSSPAAFLKPGGALVHEQTVFHFIGDKAELDRIALKTLGVSLMEIESKGLKKPSVP